MIIGLGHKARNGKTTIAEYLQLKYDFKIVNFADALYQECREAPRYIEISSDGNTLWPVSHADQEVLDRETGKPWIEMPDSLSGYRHVIQEGMTEKCAPLLQWWGTDFRRKYFDQEYWVAQVRDIIMRSNANTDWAIGDMRFTNEAVAVKYWGGETWKVDRQYTDPSRDPNHPSEVDLDDWTFDRVLMNTGTKGDLFRIVDENMKEIGGRYADLS